MAGRRVGCRPIVEDKWSLVIVEFLGHGPRRFTELRRGIDGVSQRMLTVTLRNLERDGILSRTVHNVMPPNISYALTPMGESLLDSFRPMMRWAAENVEQVEKARDEYDAR
ncbi:winged helix-turn-helix transcriptional regulator [Cryptosporangium phraense]|uniref:Helix-turn-helix transcriptional regulator n=1 Tax=Cryptosporangium phraense TaxID=2593070 RepID=A0A545ANU7_9ACTN|nr:helix-turn-helix domain-containing protein [Cryptosporangium phraense]TQS43012.1 helix-turn-helix transcriptional regulator [Cryptosporangium phraense]